MASGSNETEAEMEARYEADAETVASAALC